MAQTGKKFRVAILVGSLRAGSLSRKVAHALIARAAPQLACEIVEIRDLPLFDEDAESACPPAWSRFRAAVKAADAVLFVTPEYNRSMPGCLKNALDVGSRPEGESVWSGLPAAVVSVTPYKLGAFGANHALRQTFVFLDMPVMQQPEAYLGGAAELFDEADELGSAETDQLLRNFMSHFLEWIRHFRDPSAESDMDAFMRTRDQAATAYVNGDAQPLDRLLATKGMASFFPPKGAAVTGAEAVKARYDADAKRFAPGGDSRLEVLHAHAGGDLAFWSGIQHAHAMLGGKPVPMALRITEVFRREGGDWKLIHRHADTASEADTDRSGE